MRQIHIFCERPIEISVFSSIPAAEKFFAAAGMSFPLHALNNSVLCITLFNNGKPVYSYTLFMSEDKQGNILSKIFDMTVNNIHYYSATCPNYILPDIREVTNGLVRAIKKNEHSLMKEFLNVKFNHDEW